MALNSLSGAGECGVSVTALIECIACLLDDTQLLIHHVLQLLTDTDRLTVCKRDGKHQRLYVVRRNSLQQLYVDRLT